MRKRKLIIGVLIGLLLLCVAAVAALFFVDPSALRGRLEARGTNLFGRQVKIDGLIHLERSLRPRIIVEDISIGNPDWASGAHFATAEKVGVRVALLPLLRGDLKILDVSFNGVDLFIEEGPEDANNYTFGDRGDSKSRGVLPPIEQLLVKDTVINFRSADGSSKRIKINKARLWNIPGQPERIEGEATVKEMKFAFMFVAEKPVELSGPQSPWFAKITIDGPDLSIRIDGSMAEAFKWEKSDCRITISGKQADVLETSLGVDFPTSGPFELSASVNNSVGFFTVTDIVAQLHGPPETPPIKISQGEASGGRNDPIQIALQGKYGDTPFSFISASKKPFEGISQTTPWPIEAQLIMTDTILNIKSTMIPATAAERFELDVQLLGETTNTLAQVLSNELPQTGPYQLSSHLYFEEGSYTFSDLEGHFKDTALWETIRIERGSALTFESGFVKVSIDAHLDGVPLSMSFEGGPGTTGESGETVWPVKIDASSSGAILKGDGSVVTGKNRMDLLIATSIKGDRLESLNPLVGVSLPRTGTYDLSMQVYRGEGIHELRDLSIQMGANRITGDVRLEDKTPRPFLTGKLSSDSLKLAELLDTTPKPSSKTRKAEVFDRPIRLDWLNDIDAKLELNVKRIADSSISIENMESAVTLSNGKLSAPFRGELAGATVDGELHLSQSKNLPGVSLKATLGQIDVGQAFKQLGLFDKIVGTADAVVLDGSSQGATLHALLKQATITLRIEPANLSYTGQLVAQDLNFKFNKAKFFTEKDRQITAVITGTLQKVPFNATVSTTNLLEIRRTDVPLPLRVSFQREDVKFDAEVTVTRPFENKEFDLKHELSGKEIEGLAPLLDFTLPLKGEFHTTGTVKARGNKITYEQDLRVGQSDIKLFLTVLRKPTRPKITGSILAKDLHVDNITLLHVDEENGNGSTENRSRVIPDYTFPVDVLLAADLDFDIKAKRIRFGLEDLGDFVSKVRLKDGFFKSSTQIRGFLGAQISGEYDINAAVKPPLINIELNANDINYAILLRSLGVTDILDGNADLYIDLTGSGATRYNFLEDAEGRISFIAGSGKISGRGVDLWAADLIPTMLSLSWQREDVTEMNCMVSHIELKDGFAEIEDLILDTQRITIAGSGILNLETEALDLLFAPRPKQASLVSLANPVTIKGTLSEPKVSVTKIPRKRRLAATGTLSAIINPVFLIFAFSDTGTGEANPCESAVERARKANETDLQMKK
ncbi:MAG: AsmA family protein [Deltaproteobacteria bacterium]|jgi:uncharacterized protein involved in outer membrane biogenesis|nr:AsmA family protein [Deltaproteobacteria bacterium]